ncbi:serine hydrolase domain-containing protein [Nocardioides sp. CPCC 205120]|uniref:serine hydrolase domain-containing protein n=1 Tax=Nocardioides sp. CPCC 205120 TaxID=3406462 RepID=UPI003B50E3E3
MTVWLRPVLTGALLLGAAAPVAHAVPALPAGAASPPAAGAAAAVDAEEVEAWVRERTEAAGVPGAAWAVVGPDDVEVEGVLGEDGAGDPVTPATPFWWGSVAKPLTSTVLVTLAADGAVDLDAPVVAYLPDFRMQDEAASDTVTVRQLMSSTGGVPPAYDLTDAYDAGRRPADVLPELAGREAAAEPGERHVYSSVGYLVLTALVEEVTGQSYAEVVAERVLEPAGMTDAVTTAEAAEAVPPGHRYVAGRAVPFTTGFDPAGAGYGYVGGDLGDAVAFARLQLSGSPVLSPEQRDDMVRGDVDQGEGRTYGLGWRQWDVPGGDGERMVWVSGASPGYFASVVVLPDLDRAIVVLQNAYGSFQEPALLTTAWGLAALFEGGEPQRAGTDPTYVVLLAVLGGLALALLALVARGAWVLARPGSRARRATRRRVAVTTGLALVALAALAAAYLALPGIFGVELGQLVLWAPDLAWLVQGGLGLTGLLALVRVGVAARLLRAGDDDGTARDAGRPRDHGVPGPSPSRAR